VATPYNPNPVPETQPQDGAAPVDQFQRGSGGNSSGGRPGTFRGNSPPPAGSGARSNSLNRSSSEEEVEDNFGGGGSGASGTETDERPFGTRRESIDPSDSGDVIPPAKDENSSKFKTQRPNIGTPARQDDPIAGETVIPKRQPAPIEFPPEPGLEDNQPADADELQLDGSPSAFAVAPKTRMALKGRFSSPAIVRLRLRPNRDWTPAPEAPQIARQ
jgi:hypothetical protein